MKRHRRAKARIRSYEKQERRRNHAMLEAFNTCARAIGKVDDFDDNRARIAKAIMALYGQRRDL